MNENSNSHQPSRYLDRFFADRKIFTLSHLLLALLGGATFVISAIASHRLLGHTGLAGWARRGTGPILALAFFIPTLPYVISYKCNVDEVDERVGRTVIFAAILALTSLLVDACTVVFIGNDLFFLGLGVLYVFQTIGYVWIGDRLFSRDDNFANN